MILHFVRAYDPISDELTGEYLLTGDAAKQVMGLMIGKVHEESEIIAIHAKDVPSIAKILGIPLDPRHDHFLEFNTA